MRLALMPLDWRLKAVHEDDVRTEDMRIPVSAVLGETKGIYEDHSAMLYLDRRGRPTVD